ncbi:zinc finger protein ZAT5-like [Primulina huaijiensis]|uniref:zinc finger protein ZAT5-like n=1 Tax=Primulina huaijiensis TaxID=1492673 RepID=UPI003CC72227
MDMEATAGPPMDCNKDISSPNIAKGKRTKRLRFLSPITLTINAPPFLEDNTNNHQYPSPSAAVSAASSEESTTTEEEDTARCLILLANSHFSPTKQPRGHLIPIGDNNKRNKVGGDGAAGMYACKTCDRVFSSFQALGGHRASHKKPKNEKKSSSTSLFMSDEEDFPSPSISSYKSRMSLSLQLNSATNASPRIHECSYCGAEFTSGQALGGHMRRHRASGPVSPLSKPPLMPTVHSKEFEFDLGIKPKNGLSLDLNLPAPEEEHQR